MRLLPALSVAAVALFLAGCSGSPDSSTNPPGDQKGVDVGDFNFNPTTVNIEKGSSIKWTNSGNQKHTVTADGGAFESGDMAKGDPFTFEFNDAGSFPYHCKYHPTMTGSITVG